MQRYPLHLMKKIILCATFMTLLRCLAHGYAGTSDDVLSKGPGALDVSLGGNLAGLGNEAYSVFSNPAAVSTLKKTELITSNISYFEQTSQTTLGLLLPVDGNVFSAMVTSLNSGGFVQRVNPWDEGSTFGVSSNLLQLAYCREMLRGFSLGFTLKEYYQLINAKNLALTASDIGAYYQPFPRLGIGLNVRNVVSSESSYYVDGQKTMLPLGGDLGVSWGWQLKKAAFKIIGGLQIENSQNNASAGLECAYGPAAVRVGANTDGMAAGVGTHFGDFTIDYAMAMNVLGPVNTVSVGVKFGKTKEEYEEDIKRIYAGQILTPKEAHSLSKHHYQEGLKQMNANQTALAIVEFDTAQLLDPQNMAVRRELLAAKAKLDVSVDAALIARYRDSAMKSYLDLNMQNALVEWQRLLLVDPNNELAKEYIAKITVRLSDSDVKSAVSKMDVVKNTEISRLMDEAAHLYSDKSYQKTIAVLRKVLKIEPSYQPAKEKLAYTLTELNGQVSLSIEKASKLIDEKKYIEAAAPLQFARDISPDDPQLLELLAKVNSEIVRKEKRDQRKKNDKRYYEAVSLYMQANPSVHPNPQYKKAYDICKEILSTDPFFDAAKDLIGRIDAREGRREIRMRRPDDE